MIELHQFPPAFGLPNPSPFCMKVEGLLRLAGLPYVTVVEDDPRRAPLGKLPWLTVDGRAIADSSVIVGFLRQEYGFDAEDCLDARTRAEHRAFIAMLEDRVYWAVMYLRWIDANNWPLVRETFFARLPLPLRGLVPRLARAKVRRDLKGQGLGLHDGEFIIDTAMRDWQALSEYLGQRPYFGGDTPVLLDVVALSMLANGLRGVVRSPLRDHLMADGRLMAYAQRGLQRVYGVSLN